MNQEIKKRWIQALTSGDYSQTQENLRDRTGFCCLGVLCDLYFRDNTESSCWIVSDDDVIERDTFYCVTAEGSPRNNHEVLPYPVALWAGLEKQIYPTTVRNNEEVLACDVVVSAEGLEDTRGIQISSSRSELKEKNKITLAELNDSQYSFAALAAIIDKEL